MVKGKDDAIDSRGETTSQRVREIATELLGIAAAPTATLARPDSGLAGSETATLVLDRDGKITFFTQSAHALLGTVSSDGGKQLKDLQLPFADPQLHSDIQQVLTEGTTIDQIVSSADGHWYRRNVCAYLINRNTIGGAVITFVDVTESKQAEHRLDQLTAREREVIDAVVEGQSNKAIAFKLGLSQRTVEYHRKRAMAKLKVATLPALVQLLMVARQSR